MGDFSGSPSLTAGTFGQWAPGRQCAIGSCISCKVFRYRDRACLRQISLTFQAQCILSLLSSSAVPFGTLCGEQCNNQFLTSNYALPFIKEAHILK